MLNCPTNGRPNPFSTRFVRPGSIDYIFGKNETAAKVVARLKAGHWRGEITGPHGSGKSALLAALIPEICRAGKEPLLAEVHDGQRRLPLGPLQLETNHVLIVDGYEQLGLWARVRLKGLRRRGIGLLVTSHRPVGFPVLYNTRPSLEVAEKIVERLAPDVSNKDVKSLFDHRGGNIREMLFDLYDTFEQKRQGR